MIVLADEQVAAAITSGLRRRGVELVLAKDAGLLHTPDEAILERCAKESWLLLTQDWDFVLLHWAGAEHAGIVYARQGKSGVGELVETVVLLAQFAPSDWRGRLELV